MIDVLVTEYLDDESVAALGAEFSTHYDPTLVNAPERIMTHAPGVSALIVRARCQVRGGVLDAFDRLRVIGRLGVGLDNIDVDACAARGIEVCPATGANAVSVAEWTIAAILVGMRNVWQATPAVLAGRWPRNDLMLTEISGKRLGLVGFGSIARLVASRARALGMEVLACGRPETSPEPQWASLGVTAVDFGTLLASADVVSLHVPLVAATHHLIDAEALARMNPSALLVNSSRGGLVDEAALCAALRAHRLRGAVLDVVETEPLPAGSAFVDVPNLILTPHISGVTEEANRRVSAMVVSAVQRVLRQMRAQAVSMTERVECVVAGAGAVGLAIARELAQDGREVLVLEAAEAIGTGTSSRNSEVIHAGIYYPTGSLKARFCVAGRRLLYGYCAERGVPHRRLGKLIVATHEDQLAKLAALRQLGEDNGVDDLELVGRAACAQLEPALRAVAAVVSPSTGIVDSHALMLSWQGDAEAAGATVVLRAAVEGGEITSAGVLLHVGGAAPMDLACRWFINAAGLGAPSLARRIAGVPPSSVPEPRLCKGNYYTLTGRAPFSRLVYPIPEGAGLGVHLTLDLGGQARFGPDVEWVEREVYDVDPARSAAFYAAIRQYWPDLPDGALQPGYAGIRPKISGPGEPPADFVVAGPRDHGCDGLVNLFGIESPGLTAAMAIASRVAEIVSA